MSSQPLRRTKIVVTLGPALDDEDILKRVIEEGADVFRANLSHGYIERYENCIHCKVIVGGELSNNKGINRQGGGLSAAALTDKDRADIIEAVRMQADYIAISFPRNADDVKEARVLVKAAGGIAGIISKIER